MKMLEQSFDYVIQVLPGITGEQLKQTWHVPSWKGRTEPDGRAMSLNMFVHTAHHRAQCEVYMRVKGIEPPDYAFDTQKDCRALLDRTLRLRSGQAREGGRPYVGFSADC